MSRSPIESSAQAQPVESTQDTPWGDLLELQAAAQDLGFELAQAHGDDHHDDAHHDDDHADAHHDDHHEDEHHDHEHGAALLHEDGHGHDGHHQGHGDPHADAHDAEYVAPEAFPNIYTLMTTMVQRAKSDGEDGHGYHGHHEHVLAGPFAVHGPFYVDPIFSTVYGLCFAWVVMRIMRRPSVERPSKLQVFVEFVFGALYDFFADIIGKDHARKYVPFVASMWFFILLSNWAGLVPFLKAPMGHFWVAAGLAVCSFFFVNGNAIKEGGIKYFFWHLAGSPTGILWLFAPLIFFLEFVGTFVKPLSLALRLSGNIFGEDKLLAAFLGLGLMIGAGIFGTNTPLVGIPLHFPFLFLVVVTSTIQATIFTLLTSVYIAMLLPHDHHDEDHGHEAEHATA